MSFARYYKISSYCLITAGFIAIAATGSVDIFSLAVFGGALGLSWFLDTAQLRKRIPGWLLNTIAVAYFPMYLFDYLFLSRSFVVSTIHMIFCMAAVKLMTRSTDRDYVYLYLISFAELVAASTLTIDITFALSLFVFLISAVCTLVLSEMKRSNARAQSQGKIQPFVVSAAARGTGMELLTPFPAKSMSWMSLAMTLSILIMAVPIFFLIPRVSLGIFNRPSSTTQMVSGFSEKVELGEIGTIKESDTIVMRVKLGEEMGKVPGNLKWRGVALDHYDGRAWHRSQTSRARVIAGREYFRLERSVQGADVLFQTFFLEALSTDVVFACHKPLAISSDLGFLSRDPLENLYTMRHPFKVRYTAVSDVTPVDPKLIPEVTPPLPEDIQAIYLQLPTLDPRIATLAKQVTRTAAHPFHKAAALEAYLKRSYDYSLDLKGTPHSADPLAMFLFEVRKGHCEYFASAMTIMLRQLGIPARMVNGFRTGEYNTFGAAWTVRQYNAHSWVEAYYSPYGWIEFDPTPPDPVRSRSSFLRMIWNLADAVDLWWTDEVVNYTFWRQSAFFREVRTRLMEFQKGLRDTVQVFFKQGRSQMDRLDLRKWLTTHGPIAAAILLLMTTIVLILRRRWNFWGFLRALRRATRSHDLGFVVTSFYADALDLLKAYGRARARNQTPLEFAHSLAEPSIAAPFTSLTHMYNKVRFGSAGDPEDLSETETLLRSLKNALRQAKPK
jgi:hypothetical protein